MGKCKNTLAILAIILIQLAIQGQSEICGIDEENFPGDPGEFGRNDPFMPLVGMDEKARKIDSAKTGEQRAKGESDLVIRLVAVFAGNGYQNSKPAAIVEENGGSRLVFVGDRVAGMKVTDIRRSKIVLSRDDEIYLLRIGEKSEEIRVKKNLSPS